MLDATTQSQTATRQPYKGLATYDPDDAHNFFGRETETQILLGKIFSSNMTLLFAGTGTGKSSLLRAGVLPELTDKHQLDVAYYADWVQEPVAGVKQAIQDALTANGRVSGPELRGVAELYPFLKLCAAYASDPLVLMFDQFEELFRYHAHSGQLLVLIDQLVRALNDKTLPLSVVFAIREDFLAELNIFKGRLPGLFDNYYRLERLKTSQAREAIERPLIPFEFHCEPGFVDQLLKDLTQREAQRQQNLSVLQSADRQPELFVEPPYLQLVCQRLWQECANNPDKTLTLTAYHHLQGTENIIKDHVAQVMAQLTLRDQSLAFEMFQYLVTGRGTKMAYRAEDLADRLRVPLENLQPVLSHLEKARILRKDNRPDGVWYELYHDVFAEIMRGWTEEFQKNPDAYLYNQIVTAARQWRASGQPEQSLLKGSLLSEARVWAKTRPDALAADEQTFLKQSLQRHYRGVWLRGGIVAAITLFAIIAAISWFDANTQRNEVQRQARFARIRSLLAYAYQDNAEDQRERAALLARHAFLLNQQYHGNMQAEIDIALRTIFHTTFITAEPYNSALIEQVCQKVHLKIALTPAEWQQLTGNALPYQPACPELTSIYPLQLRRAPMRTNNYMALSLNMADAGGYGKLAHDVQNEFEDRGETVFDKATGLTWQKSGSEKELAYADAQEYVAELNRQKFGGYDDWRLPTVEELLSLMEPAKQANDLYLNPIFVIPKGVYPWYWSADLYQRKGEGSSESAWDVNFYYGSVDWDGVGISNLVRAVRP